MVTTDDRFVEFRFFRPQARQVCVAGDFNNWTLALPMVRAADGYWVARLELPAGEFQFRYWADGQWFTDFAAFGLDLGPFGANSVVRVDPKAA